MVLVSLLLSVVLPLQVHPNKPVASIKHVSWAVQAIADATKIIGIGNYRYKEKPVSHNPELLVREPTFGDKPIPRRKQYIQEYVN